MLNQFKCALNLSLDPNFPLQLVFQLFKPKIQFLEKIYKLLKENDSYEEEPDETSSLFNLDQTYTTPEELNIGIQSILQGHLSSFHETNKVKNHKDIAQVNRLCRNLTGSVRVNFFIKDMLNVEVRLQAPNLSKYVEKYLIKIPKMKELNL